jgi:hypothetical protein
MHVAFVSLHILDIIFAQNYNEINSNSVGYNFRFVRYETEWCRQPCQKRAICGHPAARLIGAKITLTHFRCYLMTFPYSCVFQRGSADLFVSAALSHHRNIEKLAHLSRNTFS